MAVHVKPWGKPYNFDQAPYLPCFKIPTQAMVKLHGINGAGHPTIEAMDR